MATLDDTDTDTELIAMLRHARSPVAPDVPSIPQSTGISAHPAQQGLAKQG